MSDNPENAFIQNYRDSGMDWVGEIPSHWRIIRIKDLSKVKRGASPRPIDDPKYFDNSGEFSWVRICDVTKSSGYLSETEQKLSVLGAALSVKRYPGDLFLSIAGTVGRPCITKIKACIHDGFVYFPELKDAATIKYMYHLFDSGLMYDGLGKLGTQLNLNSETVGRIELPIPPLPEQIAIAAYLDKTTALIDKQRALLERKKALLQEHKKALIHEAVTKGLEAGVPMKASGLDWIGEVPAGWNIARAGDFLRIRTGSEDVSFADDQGSIPFYTCGRSMQLCISPAFFGASILLAGNGDISNIKYVDHSKGFNAYQRVYVLRTKRLINLKFTYWLFDAHFARSVSTSQKGSVIEFIKIGDIRTYAVPLPSFSEQIAIAAYLDKTTALIDEKCQLLERKINLLRKLRASIIHEAVTKGLPSHAKEMEVAA